MKAICDNKKIIIYGVLVIAWMILVFAFSGQNGVKSKSTSGYITERIVKIVIKVKPDLEPKKIKEDIDFVVRKMAHFSVYFVGGIVIFNFLSIFSMRLRSAILLTIILGSLYAISDEMHQLFIFERAGQIRDVFIDSAGVIIATLLIGKIKEEKWKN